MAERDSSSPVPGIVGTGGTELGESSPLVDSRCSSLASLTGMNIHCIDESKYSSQDDSSSSSGSSEDSSASDAPGSEDTPPPPDEAPAQSPPLGVEGNEDVHARASHHVQESDYVDPELYALPDDLSVCSTESALPVRPNITDGSSIHNLNNVIIDETPEASNGMNVQVSMTEEPPFTGGITVQITNLGTYSTPSRSLGTQSSSDSANGTNNLSNASQYEAFSPIVPNSSSIPPIIASNSVIHVHNHYIPAVPPHSSPDVSEPFSSNDHLPAIRPELRSRLENTRKREIQSIRKKVAQFPITYVQGPFGVGKTETALEVARQLVTSDSFSAHHISISKEVTAEGLASKLNRTLFCKLSNDCPKEEFAASLRTTKNKYIVVVDVNKEFFDEEKIEFLKGLSACKNLKLLVTTDRVPLLLQDDLIITELKKLSEVDSKIILAHKGLDLCGDDDCIGQNCQASGCRVSSIAQGIPLYLNILGQGVLNGENVDEVVVGDDFERLHSWLFRQFTELEIKVASAACVYDCPFDPSHCSSIIEEQIDNACLKKIVAKLKDRFVLTPYDTVGGSKLFVMHPCLRLYLSNSSDHRDHVKIALSNFFRLTLRKLIELTKRSWRKDGLKNATLDFKREYGFYTQFLPYLNEDSTEDAIPITSILKNELFSQEWVLVKIFFFLECCVPFSTVESLARGICEACETEEASSDIGLLNLRVVALCYRNENNRRQNRADIKCLLQAKHLLYEVMPEGGSLMQDAHPCAPCVRWYYHYASGRSFSTNKKRADQAKTDFEKAISLVKKYQVQAGRNQDDEESHREMDQWEYEMCKIKADKSSDSHYGDYINKLGFAEKFFDRLGDHEQTSTAFKRVGDFCMEKARNYSEAISHFERAITIMSNLQGADEEPDDLDQEQDQRDPEILEWPQAITLLRNLAFAKCYHAFENDSADKSACLRTMAKAVTLAAKHFPDDNHLWVLKVCDSLAELQYYCADNGANFCNFEDARESAQRGLRACELIEKSSGNWNEWRRKKLQKVIENCDERLLVIGAEVVQDSYSA